MANPRRKQNRKARQLRGAVAMLSVVLVGLLILALARPKDPDASMQTDPPSRTDPSTESTTETTMGPTSPSATESTSEPTVPPTAPPDGWVELDGEKYYYQNGTALTGWLQLADGLYYLRSDGTMARGEEEIDGVRHYFTSAGREILLVNPWNYVPEGYEPTLRALPTSISLEGKEVDDACYDALVEMMNACKAAGHNVCVVSAYRTHSYQEYLFERQVTKQMANYGYTREEAEKAAATISAIPGTSEHQLGLAVDIVDTQSWELSEIQETLAGQQWLMENSWKYGFILRYPNDTTEETGIIYEPWHYRYVGTEVAAELHESGQTLEAYLAALN